MVIIILLIVIVKKYVIDKNIVSGDSMFPYLKNGEVVLVNKCNIKIKRFDVVTIDKNNNHVIVKRVIGLPHETIQIIDGNVYINGEKINDITDEVIVNSGIACDEINLNENEYFVLGDNRNNSKDSRNEEIGIIKFNEIKGKVFLRIFPFNRIGKL